MNKQTNMIHIRINGREFTVEKGLTILKAAEQHGIYIPTLCAHKELSPHGGCRLCIVEVEGFRNFPTACSTPAEDGMIIQTDTVAVNEIRQEILQLFMSEHTSSCLICPETQECRAYMGTVRKAGVTTGCRYCPNDTQCEFQEIVEKMEIKEINYPIYYRNNRVEKEDPFYDRDYNLCVLCGRCVRMCQEVRIANVLAFNYRGRETVIGPAYGRTHVEAGCEFCGACVSVCPTGALTEKDLKWEGKPDREEITTCSFCGVGCQMRLLIKEGRIIGSLPVIDDPVNNGQLCVRGRFCISEIVNGHQRLVAPYKMEHDIKVELSWDEAVAAITEQLTNCEPDQFQLLISPNCTSEDLYIAQKFARVVMRSNQVETSAQYFYGDALPGYLQLAEKSIPLNQLQKAEAVLCVGLDTRFGRSVVAVELRRAQKNGTAVISIHPRKHNLSLIADQWVQPEPSDVLKTLENLIKLVTSNDTASKNQLSEIARTLRQAKKPVILFGSEFLQRDDSVDIIAAVEKLADTLKAGVLPLPAQNNLYGAILSGAGKNILPGGVPHTSTKQKSLLKKTWGVPIPSEQSGTKKKPGSNGNVLYLIGEVPRDLTAKDAPYVISQNIYPPDVSYPADLVLPAAAFSEADGSFINGEGRIQRVTKAVNPPGKALPDWEILCRIAKKMGVKGFNFKSVAEIHNEMASVIDQFKKFNKIDRKPVKLKFNLKNSSPLKKPTGKSKKTAYPFTLTTRVVEHIYRGMPLSTWVDGSRKIFSEGIVAMNPEDARKAKLKDGDVISVHSDSLKRIWPITIDPGQPAGTLFVILGQGESILPNPQPVKIRRSHV